MTTKQLILELLLLKEKYTVEQFRDARKLFASYDNEIEELLALFVSPAESLKKKATNKAKLEQLRELSQSRYEKIIQIEKMLRNTKQTKLQQVREYARALQLDVDKNMKRDTLVRVIIAKLCELSEAEIDRLIKKEAEPFSALELLSQAIVKR